MSELTHSVEVQPKVARQLPSALDIGTFLFFIVAVFAIWTQVHPFIDLQDPSALDDTTQSDMLRKIVTLALVAAGIGLVHARGRLRGLTAMVDLPLVAVVIWFGLCSVISTAPSLALNRLGLAICVVAIAACLPLLIRSLDACISALGVVVSIVVVLCFLGVLLVPDLAIHTARDATEQRLAGNWRGVFSHKNDLAAMCNLFVITGILVTRTKSWLWGGAIIVSSIVLMWMADGKSALLLIVPVLIASFFLVRFRWRWSGFLLSFGLVSFVLLMTIGSVAFPAIHAITNAVMPDPTFTGRTDIWTVAEAAVGADPWKGHGYSIFWDTGIAYQVADSGADGATAAHAHNGYLETAISGGLPGLFLVLVWAGFVPWRNIEILKRRVSTAVERAFLEFLAQTWLFGLMISCLEAVLFNRSHPVWFTMAIAMACLQQWVSARTVVK